MQLRSHLDAVDATDNQVAKDDIVITQVTSDEAEDASGDGDGNKAQLPLAEPVALPYLCTLCSAGLSRRASPRYRH